MAENNDFIRAHVGGEERWYLTLSDRRDLAIAHLNMLFGRNHVGMTEWHVETTAALYRMTHLPMEQSILVNAIHAKMEEAF